MPRGTRNAFSLAALVALFAAIFAWTSWRAPAASIPSPSPLAPADAQIVQAEPAAPERTEASEPRRAPSIAATEARSAREPKARVDPSEPPPVLVGRVHLHPGAPADERVFVEVSTTPWQTRRDRIECDARGVFRVELARRAETVRIELDARYHFLRAPLVVEVAKLPEELAITPELGACVRGRVRSEFGDASEGEGNAAVFFAGRDAARSCAFDAGEVFELGGVPARRGLLVVELGAHSAAEQEIDPRPGELLELELVLPPDVAVAGRVVDEAGDPIEGAVVRATQSALRPHRTTFQPRELPSTQTDAEGVFRLEGLPSGSLGLSVLQAGYLWGVRDLDPLAPGERREGIVIVLERERAIVGRARFSDGVAAEGARVRARPVDAKAAEKRARTDASGAFRIGELGAGTCVVDAEAERDEPGGGASTWRAVLEHVAPSEAEIELVLQRSAALIGFVVDDLGRPIERFRVSASPQMRAFGDPLDHWVTRAFVDERGAFALDGLWPGLFDLRVRAADHADACIEGVAVPNPGEPLRCVLPRTATLGGRVRGPEGERVANALVSARAVGEEGPEAFGRTTRTDARGAFAGLATEPGRVRVAASAAVYAPGDERELEVAPGDALDELELVLRKGARIDVELAPGSSGARAVSLRKLGVALSTRIVGEVDGSTPCSFAGLAPGKYEVALLPNGEAGEASSSPSSRRVELREGELVRVVLGAP